ncbi:MAG TPA: PEGA domain-containing protein [Acidobacteriota bacterium]|nr:PEGA domain-containing protein [Acidobacteriota bacterium]
MNKIWVLLFFAFFICAETNAANYAEQFKRAESVFNSRNQFQSISMFQRLTGALEAEARKRDLENEELQLLVRSYDFLGQAQFNKNERASAAATFLKLVELNPDYKMNEDLVSKKIVDLLNEVKRDNLAMLTIRSTPEGAAVLVDGRKIGSTNFENHSVIQGKHKLEFHLDGYQTVVREIDIPTGAVQEISVRLAEEPEAREFSKSESSENTTPPEAQLKEDAAESQKIPYTNRIRAIELLREAYASMNAGNYADAERKYQEALTTAREAGDKQSQADALLNLGFLLSSSGKEAKAIPLWEEARTLAHEAGDQSREALSLYNLAIAAFNKGNMARANELYEESASIYRQLGETPRKKLW